MVCNQENAVGRTRVTTEHRTEYVCVNIYTFAIAFVRCDKIQRQHGIVPKSGQDAASQPA